jgi:hypothetical protein
MSGRMSLNKGKNGEREVVTKLNSIIERILAMNVEWSEDVVNVARKCIQRNQNQSAVGGSDLSGVFGLAIEIKRHETLHIEQWWKQCMEQAVRNNEHPVLLYRQNHQPWRCITMGHAPLPGGRISTMRVQMEEDPFATWFYQWVYYKMMSGELPRV